MKDQTTRKVQSVEIPDSLKLRPRILPARFAPLEPERNTGEDRTRFVRPLSAEPPQLDASITLGNLLPGTQILGDYRVTSTLHPHETSHPGLFLCETRTGDQVMIKLAPSQHPPSVDLWAKLPTLHHPNVLRTFRAEEHDGRYYEVQEYCRGGSLAPWTGSDQVDIDWLTDHFIPQVNEGLKYLHAQNIVHRDIKPSNIYLREDDLDGPIVLGDFDISSVLITDKTSRHTSRIAGTWAYSAPEGFPRFVGDSVNSAASRITRTADYYSLGIAIIELLTGTTSLHSCGLPDLYDFYLAGGRVELPDAPPRLLLLLKGLLVRNRQERWSGPEVDRWLRNGNLRDDMQSVINDQRFSLAKTTRPYELGGLQAVDLVSLALAMATSPTEAKSHLLESDLLSQWILNQETSVGHQVERTREKYRHSPDLALYRTIVLCDPGRPFDVPGYGLIDTIYEWPEFLARQAPTEKHLQMGPVSDLELSRLEAWLELKQSPDKPLSKKVADIRQRPIATRFEEMAFLLDRKIPYSGRTSAFMNLRQPAASRQGGHTPKEVVAESLGTMQDWEKEVPPWYRTARDRWLNGYLEAWLRQRGMADLATKAADAATVLKGNADESYDVLLRQLDPWAEKPQLIFDEESTPSNTVIQFGSESVVTLSYRTKGPGFPMGSVKLDATDEVTLDTFLVRGRKGRIVATVRPRTALMGGINKSAFRLAADRGNFWVKDDGLDVQYCTVFPLKETAKRMFVGALSGALLLGGARFISSIEFKSPVDLKGINNLNDSSGPSGSSYILASLLCLSALYCGYRMWLEVYKRSGR